MRTHTQSHKQYIYRMLYFGQETMQCTHTPNNGSSTPCRQVVKRSVGSVSTSPKNEFFSLPSTAAVRTPSTKHVDGSGTDMWLQKPVHHY